jgi:hypothetical protein
MVDFIFGLFRRYVAVLMVVGIYGRVPMGAYPAHYSMI